MRHRSPPFGIGLLIVSLAAAGLAPVGCAGGGKATTGKGGTTGNGVGIAGSGAAGTTGAAGVTGAAGATGVAGNVAGPGGSGPAGSGPTGIAGSNPSGGAGTTGQAGAATSGDGGSTSTTMDAGADHLCQEGMFTFEPSIPTVYVLVDRSGSMFHCLTGSTSDVVCADQTNTAWTKLKAAVEMVVSSLETQVRFGFATFTGTDPSHGGTCPQISQVAPKLMNAAAIKAVYDPLPFPPNSNTPGIKFESPARQALDQVGTELMAITDPGDKYILFVTDGQPDYCDDSNSLCAPDSVIGGIQNLKAKGITTVVFGLQYKQNDLPPGILQAYANAGAGETALAPVPAGQQLTVILDQCWNVKGWQTDFLANPANAACATDHNPCRGQTIGTYGTPAGPTMPYTPDPSNQAQLVSQLGTAIASVKSCVFDLGNLNGQSIKVDLTQLDQANVLVMGTKVPHSDTNGWKMDGQTQLELVGTACSNWRKPDVNTIDFQFPCSTIIFE